MTSPKPSANDGKTKRSALFINSNNSLLGNCPRYSHVSEYRDRNDLLSFIPPAKTSLAFFSLSWFHASNRCGTPFRTPTCPANRTVNCPTGRVVLAHISSAGVP